jgi:rsbT co-antagonist protein RsbR
MSDPTDLASASITAPSAGISTEGLLPQLVEHLRHNRTAPLVQRAPGITETELLDYDVSRTGEQNA